MGFRWGTTCFTCQITINMAPFLHINQSYLSSLKSAFPKALVQATLHCVGQALLQMANLDISVHVWIWRWSLLRLLNKSNNQMSDLLVPSKPWEWRIIFGMHHLPILCEASHILHNKYERPNFYRDNPLYPKIKLVTFLNEWGKKFRHWDMKFHSPHK